MLAAETSVKLADARVGVTITGMSRTNGVPDETESGTVKRTEILRPQPRGIAFSGIDRPEPSGAYLADCAAIPTSPVLSIPVIATSMQLSRRIAGPKRCQFVPSIEAS